MVGTMTPLHHRSARRLRRNARIRRPPRRSTRLVCAYFAALKSWYTAGADEMRRFVGPGPLLTDDRPLLEYHRSLPHSDDRPLDLRPRQRRRSYQTVTAAARYQDAVPRCRRRALPSRVGTRERGAGNRRRRRVRRGTRPREPLAKHDIDKAQVVGADHRRRAWLAVFQQGARARRACRSRRPRTPRSPCCATYHRIRESLGGRSERRESGAGAIASARVQIGRGVECQWPAAASVRSVELTSYFDVVLDSHEWAWRSRIRVCFEIALGQSRKSVAVALLMSVISFTSMSSGRATRGYARACCSTRRTCIPYADCRRLSTLDELVD